MFYFTLRRERLFVHFGIFCINIGGEAFAPYLSIPPKFLIRLFDILSVPTIMLAYRLSLKNAATY